MTERERFFRMVMVAGDDACWLWTGAKDKDGYGIFKVGGRVVRAHRFAAGDFALPPIIPSCVVLHSCDTPACVNPRHLRLGTQGENMADRDTKGRQAKGESNAASLLSDEAREAIKNSWASESVLARRYGVSPRTIRELRQRARSWAT